MSVDSDLNYTFATNPDLFGTRTSLSFLTDMFAGGDMVPIPNLTAAGGAAGPAVSGGGSPQHSVTKGVNQFLAVGAIILVAVLAFKVGKR